MMFPINSRKSMTGLTYLYSLTLSYSTFYSTALICWFSIYLLPSSGYVLRTTQNLCIEKMYFTKMMPR